MSGRQRGVDSFEDLGYRSRCANLVARCVVSRYGFPALNRDHRPVGAKYLPVHAQRRKAGLNRGRLKVPEVSLKSTPAGFWSVGSSNDNQESLLCGSSQGQTDSVDLQLLLF